MDQQQGCHITATALSRIDGKNVPLSVEQLTRAYKHSRNCSTCGEVLGNFIGDIIKMMGVKLPKSGGGESQECPCFSGNVSDAVTEELGPGTVKWSVAESGTPYKLKPTVSSLGITVDQLEQKCRLKDHLIETMAEELRNLSDCANWSGTDLLNRVHRTEPKSGVDFDRTSLANYLYNKPLHGLETMEEEPEKFVATNPLGLTVVRQVGPDSLLLEWNTPKHHKVHCYEIFVNGLFVQRIRSPGRTKALIHPIDLSGRVYITLNALTFMGEPCEAVTINYPA